MLTTFEKTKEKEVRRRETDPFPDEESGESLSRLWGSVFSTEGYRVATFQEERDL